MRVRENQWKCFSAGTDSKQLRAYSNGVVNIGSTLFSLTARMAGRIVTAVWVPEGVLFGEAEGEVIAEYAWPPKGTGYVGISRALTRVRA